MSQIFLVKFGDLGGRYGDWSLSIGSHLQTEKVYIFFCLSLTPRISGWLRTASAKGSRHKINSRGNNGHPCLIGNDGDRNEDSLTWEVGWEYKACNAAIKGPLKPYLVKVANIKGQLSRSKAFCASRLRIRMCRPIEQVIEVNGASCVVACMSSGDKSHLILAYKLRDYKGKSVG